MYIHNLYSSYFPTLLYKNRNISTIVYLLGQKIKKKGGGRQQTQGYISGFVLAAQLWMSLISWEPDCKGWAPVCNSHWALAVCDLGSDTLCLISVLNISKGFDCEFLMGSRKRKIKAKIFTKKIQCKYNVNTVRQKALNLDFSKSFASSLPLKFINHT